MIEQNIGNTRAITPFLYFNQSMQNGCVALICGVIFDALALSELSVFLNHKIIDTHLLLR